jgi:hypothetical protein
VTLIWQVVATVTLTWQVGGHVPFTRSHSAWLEYHLTTTSLPRYGVLAVLSWQVVVDVPAGTEWRQVSAMLPPLSPAPAYSARNGRNGTQGPRHAPRFELRLLETAEVWVRCRSSTSTSTSRTT